MAIIVKFKDMCGSGKGTYAHPKNVFLWGPRPRDIYVCQGDLKRIFGNSAICKYKKGVQVA